MYVLFTITEGKVSGIYGPFDSEEMAYEFRDEFTDASEQVYITELVCPYTVYRDTLK